MTEDRADTSAASSTGNSSEREKEEGYFSPSPDNSSPAEAPEVPTDPASRGDELPEETKGRGVVYVAQLPHGWTRVQVIRYFEKFGEVTRVFLNKKDTKGNRKGRGFIFTDGWIEYRKKRHAKKLVALMHGAPIGGKKRNKHAQDLLMLSYLKGFDFGSLYEDVMHVKRTRQDRLNAQMARVKKESQIYMELLEQKHSTEQLKQRLSKKNDKKDEGETDTPGSADLVFAATNRAQNAGKRQKKSFEWPEQTKKQKPQGPTGPASVSPSILKMLAA